MDLFRRFFIKKFPRIRMSSLMYVVYTRRKILELI